MNTPIKTSQPESSHQQVSQGVITGITAYLFWGFAPIYFKLVRTVPPTEVLAHRVIWSTILLLVLVHFRSNLFMTFRKLRDPRILKLTLISSILIGGNWLVFIWAVVHDRVLEASLGYYINPLVNVLLGRVILTERLSRNQGFSVILAASGVGYLTVSLGGLPWVAVLLACTFSLYSLLRKKSSLDVVQGLAVETSLLFPVALVYILALSIQGKVQFLTASWDLSVLLILAGLVTTIPLLLFGHSAKRLRLSTIGFLQYIAPTCTFLLAVLAWGEPFDRSRQVCFVLIWLALILYSADALWKRRSSGTESLTGKAFLE